MVLDSLAIDEKWIKDNETKEFDEIIYDDNNVNVNDVMNSVVVPITKFADNKEKVDVNNNSVNELSAQLDNVAKEISVKEIMDSVDAPEVEFEEDKDIEYYKREFNEVYSHHVDLEKIIKDNSLMDSIFKVISSEDINKKQNKSGTIETSNLNELLSFTNSLAHKYGKSNYDMWNDIEKEKYIQLYCKVYNASREHAIKSISNSMEGKVSSSYVGKNRNTIIEQGNSARSILLGIYNRYNELSYNDQQLFLELYNQLKKVAYMNVTSSEMEQRQLDELLNVASQVSEFNNRLNNRTK